MHIFQISLVHIVETPFCIVRLCHVDVIIIVQYSQRTVYRLRLSYLYRRRVSEIQMFQHFSAFRVSAHLENIVGIFFAVRSPVILNRLERSIHLINP